MSKLILWLSEYKGCCIVFFVLFSSHRTKLVSRLSLFLLVILCLCICSINVLETRINCVNGFCVKSIERSRYRYSFSLSECQPSQAHRLRPIVRLRAWNTLRLQVFICRLEWISLHPSIQIPRHRSTASCPISSSRLLQQTVSELSCPKPSLRLVLEQSVMQPLVSILRPFIVREDC